MFYIKYPPGEYYMTTTARWRGGYKREINI